MPGSCLAAYQVYLPHYPPTYLPTYWPVCVVWFPLSLCFPSFSPPIRSGSVLKFSSSCCDVGGDGGGGGGGGGLASGYPQSLLFSSIFCWIEWGFYVAGGRNGGVFLSCSLFFPSFRFFFFFFSFPFSISLFVLSACHTTQ